MKAEKRDQLIEFCIKSSAYIQDVAETAIDRSKYEQMNSVELQQEADWLDDLLHK